MRNDQIWDAVVIGGGPAGAIAARQLAMAGAEVVLVERKRFPRPKVCGACLNASAVQWLDSLGLGSVASREGLPLDRLSLGVAGTSGGRRLELALPGGCAISRPVLDSALVQAAEAEGVTFLAETQATVAEATAGARRVELASTQGARALGRSAQATITIRGRIVVVAAGLTGTALGAGDEFSTRVAPGSRVGAGCLVADERQAYRQGTIFMAVGRHGYVGLTRTAGGLNIASAFDPGFLKASGGPANAARAVLAEAGFPEVPALHEAAWSGTLPLSRQTRPVAHERLFLVGDAAGYVEPFTGQGMTFAIEGANALIPLALRGVRDWHTSLARDWVREYRRTISARQWPCHLLASIVRRPRLARFAFELAGVIPTVPGALIRMVNRPLRLNSFALRQ